MNKDLYLVRHGQTIFNLKRIIQGWSDSPLTQLGCDQAARAAMFLRARGIEPDHAYTSTLHRTEQTIANLWPGLAYERLDGLREWFFGDFEAERVMLMPRRPWRDFYRQFGGEGQMQVRERMVATLTELMQRPDHTCARGKPWLCHQGVHGPREGRGGRRTRSCAGQLLGAAFRV